jgi:hypothetical protein
LRRDEAEIVRG